MDEMVTWSPLRLPVSTRLFSWRHLWGYGAVLLMLGTGCRPPTTRTPEGRPAGARVYAVYCVGCHGPDGARGTPASHLTDAAETPRDELRRVIEEGRKAMPGWKERLAPDEVSAVIDYIRTFRPAKPEEGDTRPRSGGA